MQIGRLLIGDSTVYFIYTVLFIPADFVYFADDIVYENPSEFLNNVRYLIPRQELMNEAYAVQSTAYALMAHIR